jgi:hypothetical protein
MATIFGLADADELALRDRAISQWHPELAENGVRVQLLMATSDVEDVAAVKHGGYPASATIRVVPLKDRLTKGYDAEMLIDRDSWNLSNEASRLALLDHELSHLEVKKRKVKMPKGYKGEPQFAVDTDDLGRPKLKLRKGDYNAGDGFKDVIQRHGDKAIEFDNLARCYGVASLWKHDGEA